MKNLTNLTGATFTNVHQVNEQQFTSFVDGNEIANLYSQGVISSNIGRKPNLSAVLTVANEMEHMTYSPTSIYLKLNNHSFNATDNTLHIHDNVVIMDGLVRISALEYISTKLKLGQTKDVELKDYVFNVVFVR